MISYAAVVIHEFCRKMAQNLPSSSLLASSLLVGLITLFDAAFVKLYRARMLLIERRLKGLVSIPKHPAFFVKKFINRRFIACCARTLIFVWTSPVSERLLGPDTQRCPLPLCFWADWCRELS